jgi:hypothetical protein
MSTFALKIGYSHYLMTPANAAKVMELLSAAPCVSTAYLAGATHYVESEGEALSFEPFTRAVTPKAEVEAMRAAERADWEAAKAAKAAAANG